MQAAFYLAGEITQVKESIPWVRCASGNVLAIIREGVNLCQKCSEGVEGVTVMKNGEYWIKRVSVQCVHAEESNGITTKVVTLKEIFEEGNYIDDDEEEEDKD